MMQRIKNRFQRVDDNKKRSVKKKRLNEFSLREEMEGVSMNVLKQLNIHSVFFKGMLAVCFLTVDVFLYFLLKSLS